MFRLCGTGCSRLPRRGVLAGPRAYHVTVSRASEIVSDDTAALPWTSDAAAW
jgi:hypothetical protein